MTMTTREYHGFGVFEMSVDTDCPQLSGDTSTTLIRIADTGGGSFRESEIDHDYPRTIDIRAQGNHEANLLSDALIWAGEELKRQIAENPKPEPPPSVPHRFNREALQARALAHNT